MSKSEIAVNKFKQGYACSQAVACAFAEDLKIDEKVLYKMAEGFAAGMGGGKVACGAITGAGILSGLVNSDGNITDAGNTKAKSKADSSRMVDLFEERIGAITCKDIKGKKHIPCTACIEEAVRIAEEVLVL